jgi:hypothetical protein
MVDDADTTEGNSQYIVQPQPRHIRDDRATVLAGGDGVYGQVLGRSPEVVQRRVALPVGLQLSFDAHLAVDGHVVE